MEGKNIIHAGVWAFLIVYLLGVISGRLDGAFLLIFFILAVGVSFGVEYYVPRWRAERTGSEGEEARTR